jgi:hypothetical protein
MNKYRVNFGYADERGVTHITNSGVFFANSEADARECAMTSWWDPRLEAASCSPICETRLVREETDNEPEGIG